MCAVDPLDFHMPAVLFNDAHLLPDQRPPDSVGANAINLTVTIRPETNSNDFGGFWN